ncbi:DNA methyltransferase [Mesorhizobium sp.]|uniref:site-specific DNA-methyltransferase n=1 Tax=Mesorhizobium sp. TaxID=1871066 RepID=UPI000FE49E6E|nr:DNA methyltransferase [Mesorhizobium sp.]RWE64689.1 MAG: DNA methylase N-4 [Mesorhizobium sp.]
MKRRLRNAETWSPHAIEQIPLASLKPHLNTARRHSKSQIRKLATAIREFGFIAPIIIDEDNRTICGHARIEAAKLEGMESVPAIRVEHLTETQIRAFMLADNRLPELGTWDAVRLQQELRYLVDMDFEAELTGFDTADIDILTAGQDISADPADNVPDIDPALPVVSRAGDVWTLRRHRLACSDARLAGSFETLLGTERAQMIITDPPYNVPINGHVSGRGVHAEFAMASGEMSDREFQHDFLEPTFRNLAAYSTNGSIHFAFMDWKHANIMLSAGLAVYSELKNICVWAKSNAGMGSLYRSRHELIFVWKSGAEPHINNIKLGRHGRNRTNVWEYPGTNGFGPHRVSDLAMHPTVKPVALVADAIRDCSKHNGLILDPFSGSGTTIIAAERTGRRAAAIEIDPIYVDTAIRRWQSLTGGTAVDAFSGLSFAQRQQQAQSAAPCLESQPRRLSITAP